MQTLRDSEDESQPAEASKPSLPTGKLTNKDIQKNNDSTRPISPRAFTDWEGENKVIKSKELTKSVYAHGYEAGVVSPEDLIPCPIQDDPNKFQRNNCARVTDQGIDKLRDKIIDLAISRKPGMAKFEAPMPYSQSEQAVGYLDMTTEDCVFFHKDGRYWSYKKYTPEKITTLIAKADSFKLASKNQGPRPEL